MKTLFDWLTGFAALVVVAAFGSPLLVAADPPEYGIPPGEVPKAVVAFTSSQSEDTADWSIKDVNIPAVWAKGVTGKGFTADVLDTMGATDHPDLAGQLLPGKSYTGEALADQNGHGVWCAGHIVAKKDGKGTVGGAYGAKARGRKVLTNQGGGSMAGLVKAIDDGIRDATDVFSGSLGSQGPDEPTRQAIRRAGEAGILSIFAAGNDGPGANTVDWPGAYADGLLMICVAAHDVNGVTARFSSRGRAVTISLGGVDCLGPWKNKQHATIDGTSMATPLCAALYLLWLEAVGHKLPKKERPAAFLEALARSCDLHPNRTAARGYGKPDAVKLCFGDTTPPPPPPAGKGLTLTFDEPVTVATPDDRTVRITPKAAVAVAVPAAPQPVGLTPPTPQHVWGEIPGYGPGWKLTGAEGLPFVPATSCPGGVCPPPAAIPQRMTRRGR